MATTYADTLTAIAAVESAAAQLRRDILSGATLDSQVARPLERAASELANHLNGRISTTLQCNASGDSVTISMTQADVGHASTVKAPAPTLFFND